MRIAITGASGFIGKHVLSSIRARAPTAKVVVGMRQPIAVDDSDIDIVHLDIARPAQDCFDYLGRPDVLVHLAWDGLPNYRATHHYETELPIQYGFLQSLIYSGLQGLVVTGTCLEYGMQYGPLHANTCTNPNTSYGFAKDALRKQLQLLRSQKHFNLTWARLFYTYGEGQSAQSLYSGIKHAAESKKSHFPMSKGEQLRDYLPVQDVADRITNLVLSEVDAGVLNICSGSPISIRSLVEQWIAENNWKIRPAFGEYPYPDYEPLAFWGVA